MKKMKSVMRRTSLVLLAVMMVLSVMPVPEAMAAATIRITNVLSKAEPKTAAELQNLKNEATQISIRSMPIIVTVSGISEDQYTNLYYEITNMDTGVVRTVRSASPDISDNGYYVEFPDVEFTEGLNKIVIKLDGTSVISSIPGWVNFTPSVRIEDFRIDGDIWHEDRIYPTNPYSSTIIDVTGSVYNADTVSIYRFGDAEDLVISPYNDQFGLYADERGGWANADMFLDPGDNLITFNASNQTYSYQLERTLIYDNGEPFAFDVTINDGSKDHKLVRSPSINGAGATTIDMKGKFKVDKTGNLPQYSDVTIKLIGSNGTEQTTIPITPSAIVKEESRYNVYEFTWNNIPIPSAGTYTVDFVFDGDPDVVHSNLKFTYYDSNQPYIDYVTRSTSPTDNVGSMLSDTGVTNITEQPTRFIIYADSKTQGVRVYLDRYGPGESYFVATPMSGGGNKYEFVMENVLSGSHQLYVVPMSDATTEHEFGMKRYNLQVSSVPYVVPMNFSKGIVLEDMKDIQCGSGANYCFRGRLVNMSLENSYVANRKYVEVYLNNVEITDAINVEQDGTFRVNIKPMDDPDPNTLQEGLNTLRFVLKVDQDGDGVPEPLATVSYDIYLFSDDGPEIVNIEIVQSNDKVQFVPGTVNNTYFTHESEVEFYGQLKNVTDIKLYVYRTDEDGRSEVLYDHLCQLSAGDDFERDDSIDDDGYDCKYPAVVEDGYEWADLIDSIDEDDLDFWTDEIELSPRGDTIFEFIVTNDTQITAIQTITITREAVPYQIEYPRTFTNLEGLPQANINSNYSLVEIKAEFADAVYYEDEEARRRSYDKDDDDYDIFYFEVTDLRAGRAQEIEFTIVRGQEETKGVLVLYNVNQPVVGAKFKTELKNRLRVFNDRVQLRFARNTSFMRNGHDLDNQFLTDDRKLVFGIADNITGMIDRDIETRSSSSIRNGEARLADRDINFQPVSPLFWIDAGTIHQNEDLKEALTGSGRLPYERHSSGLEYFYQRDSEDLAVPTERVELTLKYDESIVSDAWRYLTVFHYDVYEDSQGNSTNGWRNIGGVVDPKKKTITVNVERFGYFQVMYMTRSFRDVVSHEWAKNDIETLYSKGIMGPRNGSSLFRPNEAISRGEFVTMLVKIFDIPLNYKGELTFVDATNNSRSGGLWDYRYIETAARAGIVRGVGNLGRFGTTESLTREQAAVMIARAANLKLESREDKLLQSLQKSFTDASAINIYARPAVEAVVDKGIITGKQHSVIGNEKPTYYFDPHATFTRAEAAAVAMRILGMLKQIPR